ncbi:hypothetical protein M405DRAFT_819941 [Rhizopogon salebrosus TDB-379]|nr:hypothetical protein M405DRAFT_819941 [Rhizopogon salebrosus TDB-379]
MNRYFDDENICGIEGTSATNSVDYARLREIDSTQVLSPDGGDGPRTFLLLG